MGGGILNKNAFTLIELLAIIVILAIIAVITVPIILNIIENSKMGAATDSAYGFKDAVNKAYVTKLSGDSDYSMADDTYTVEELKTQIGLSLSGKEPSSNSWVTIEKNNVSEGCLQYDEFKVVFTDGKVSNTERGECEGGPTPTQYGYKTYDSATEKETELIIGISGYEATGKHAYLKYALDGVVASGIPQACVYNATYGGELCLEYGESNFNSNVGKMKTYFGYNENTWTKIDDNNWENSSQTIIWNFDDEFNHFYDSTIDANTHTDGYVSTGDYSGSEVFTCYVDGATNVGCYYES